MAAASRSLLSPSSTPYVHFADLRSRALEFLRIGIGVVWLVNLLFIVDPANRFFPTFASSARSYATSTLGGPGIAQFVASHPLLFAAGIAATTGYLAVAFLLGVTTRVASIVGAAFAVGLLLTQFGSTFFFPGGTDVGPQPLYLVIYGVLLVGGAGTSLSLQPWLRARMRALRAEGTRTARVSSAGSGGWTGSISTSRALALGVVGLLLAVGIGAAFAATLPASSGPSGASPAATPVTYLNLTIEINATMGWPQYVPANFSVPVGRVVVTITDNDAVANWSGCPCNVRGTVGGIEYVNGTAMGIVPNSNVAHTFNIPSLGVQVLSPGQSVVRFVVDFTHAGNYSWICMAPCGAGASPYGMPPMGVPGYMAGTLTVG